MCCIENVYSMHTAHKISRFCCVCSLAQCTNNFSWLALCMRVRLFFSYCFAYMHLRFAYFKAIIVSYWTFQSFFSFFLFQFTLFFVACPYLIHFIRKWMFLFFLKQRKAKTIKEKHKLSEQHTQAHTLTDICVCVSIFMLYCTNVCVNSSVCVHAFALSFTPFTLSPLFSLFFSL